MFDARTTKIRAVRKANIEQLDAYDLTLLSSLEDFENNTKCTTMVIVNQTRNIEEVRRSDNGEHVLKRVVELTDTTGEKVELTLRGSDADDKIREYMSQEKNILLLHNVLKDEYEGTISSIYLDTLLYPKNPNNYRNMLQCVSMQIKF